ncbi:SRPBCC domain-containing protein [Saccharospirillum alexandrii]|uniref:SRPBCC domain-containing protein n=1 Tax=Saccharospirillum alexandrii TaxID=2448477 RepID=UPI003735ACA9
MSALLEQDIVFDTDPATLYNAYLNAKQHSAFTKAPATIEPSEGAAFTLYGGGVEGRNIELIENQRIVQAWRGADWASGHYSLVTFELTPHKGGTQLHLTHSAFPEGAGDHLDGGWHKMYWEPIKAWLASTR